MKLRIYIIIFCCVLPNLIIGQFNNLKFKNIDTIDGLSSSAYLDVFQDKEGFLWFETTGGLNKYNGYEFEIFRPILNDSTSINNNRINTIEEDNLWVGTNNSLWGATNSGDIKIDLEAISITFAAQGAKVHVLEFNLEAAKETVNEIVTLGARHRLINVMYLTKVM